MLMDTRQLAAFCAVVEKSSFSQAAEKLGVTQPAVSLQVRALEERLGQTLLDRSGRRVEPTEAGLRLYRSAQRMIATDVVRAIAVTVIAVLSIAGVLELWHLFLLAVVFGTGDAFFGPAFNATVPQIVPQRMLVQANSLDQFIRPFMTLNPVAVNYQCWAARRATAHIAADGTVDYDREA